MSFLSNLFGGAEKINDYFADAVLVYVQTHDPIVRMAALAAAKVANGVQRTSMVNFLRTVAANAQEDIGDEDAYYRLNQLADEICLRDWTVQDARYEKQALAKLDWELVRALDKFDPTVFRRRFPEVFEEASPENFLNND